ncbi:MAG: hypothetical protein Kow0098_01050 [Ignavibacteriaceae bacterium]
MLLRFGFETIAGLLSIIALLLFGIKGTAAFAVFALLPLILRIRKINPDERELLLFYKSGNYSLAGTIAVILMLYYGWELTTPAGTPVYTLWMPLLIAGIIFVRGITGIIVFKTG